MFKKYVGYFTYLISTDTLIYLEYCHFHFIEEKTKAPKCNLVALKIVPLIPMHSNLVNQHYSRI